MNTIDRHANIRAWDIARTMRPEHIAQDMDQAFTATVDTGRSVDILLLQQPGRPTRLRIALEEDGSLSASGDAVSLGRIWLPDPRQKGSPKLQRSLGLRSGTDRLMKNIALRYFRTVNSQEEFAELAPVFAHTVLRRWLRGHGEELYARSKGENTYRKIEDAVRDLMDPEAFRLAAGSNGKPKLSRYNQVARSVTVAAEISRTNPGAMAVLLNDRTLENVKHGHPGMVIQAVRARLEQLGVDRSHWRKISGMPQETLDIIFKPGIMKAVMADVLNACGQTGARPSPAAMNDAIHFAVNCRRMTGVLNFGRYPTGEIQEGALPEQEAREQVVRLTGLLLREERPENAVTRYPELYHAADYVSHRLNTGRRIYSTKWSGLARAGERWNREMSRINLEKEIKARMERENGWLREWNSLLGEENSHDETISTVPLTDPIMLLEEGKAMGHCVGTYDRQCLQGNSRIFSLRQNNRRIATAEIILARGRWQAQQVRSHRNQQPPDEAVKAAQRIAEKYQELWDAIPKGETRHWTRAYRPATGERQEPEHAV